MDRAPIGANRSIAALSRQWQHRPNADEFAWGQAGKKGVPLIAGLTGAVEDAEPDYILVEVLASSFRFAGNARVPVWTPAAYT